jgi:hypothetical protein
MERDKASKDKRDFLKFLSGVGLGAIAAEVYERVYGIPMLEKSFRAEINYWMNKYNKADEEIKKLENENKSLKEGQEKVNELTRTLNYEDELEKESNSAIAFYKQQMNEAIGKLKQIIEKYRILLGDERVSFESSTLKVLEDLKITQEKLLKVLPYFPLIKNLSFSPSKVVNDKIYDLSVQLEVISPLNTLEKVEVKLIPVEYEYFITDYGMRKEDYSLVFPPEETRVVKLNPKGLEKEIFEVNFKDLKGGKEYLIKVEAKDLDGNVKTEEIKTPYVRGFENIAPLDDTKIGVLYLLWWGKDDNWRNYKGDYFPLLGRYFSKDKVVINKHIDWATGHKIDFFLINWSGLDYQDEALKNSFLNAALVKNGGIKFAILYETIWRLKDSQPGWDLSDPLNIRILNEDFFYLQQNYFNHPLYLRINNKPLVYIYESKGFFGDISQISNLKKRYNVFLVSDHAHPLANPDDNFRNVKWGETAKLFDALMPAAGLYDGFLWYRDYFKGSAVENPIDNQSWLEYKKIGNEKWKKFCNENKLLFIPSITAGISYRYAPWGNSTWPRLDRNPPSFKERLNFEIGYTDPKYKIAFIAEFNNFFEESVLEPDSKYGFSMLEKLKETSL